MKIHGLLAMCILLTMSASFDCAALTLEEKIRSASPDQVYEMATFVTETLAKQLPMKIDQTTTARSIVFARSTRTIIYYFEVAEPIDVAHAKSYIVNGHCSDGIRSAFMARGISVRNVYSLPNGKSAGTLEVRYTDCRAN